MIPRWARPWVFVITCLVLASAVYFLSTDGFVTYFVKVRTGQSFLEQYCPDDASKLSSIVQSGKNSCPVHAIETLRAHQSGLYETNYRRSKIRLSYELGPVMPMGFQDSAGGILSGFLISLGGFCGGQKFCSTCDYCCGERGFLKRTWALDILSSNSSWIDLPDMPVKLGRQGLKCAANKAQDILYCWGGFSYTPIKSSDPALLRQKKADAYGYTAGYKLSVGGPTRQVNSVWNMLSGALQRVMNTGTTATRADSVYSFSWTALPDLPSDLAVFPGVAVCEDGFAYVMGGGDYDKNQMHTQANRNNESQRLGAELWKFDPRRETWTQLPYCPGTPRMNHAMECINNKLYVLGGAMGGQSFPGILTYVTVLDNWLFDTKLSKWERLPNTPIISGNWCYTSVYKNRYMFLVGGFGYEASAIMAVIQPKNNSRKGMPFLTSPLQRAVYSNGLLIFDVVRQRFFWTDPLPYNNNCPMTAIQGDTLYIIGGESGIGCVLGKWVGRHSTQLIRARINLTEAVA